MGRGFPVYVAEAEGARFTDVDGHEYVDFCLGDTGAMSGHAPGARSRPIVGAGGKGITLMLPTEDAHWVGGELARRFGLPLLAVRADATDANRFAIRLARQITGRPKILVFNWCYHGTVDETFATLDDGRVARARPATSGRRSTRPSRPGWSSSTTSTRSRRELAHGDVAVRAGRAGAHQHRDRASRARASTTRSAG